MCAPNSQRLKLEEFLNEERSMVSPRAPRNFAAFAAASSLACVREPFATLNADCASAFSFPSV